MNKGRLLAYGIVVATAIFIAIGTIWPVQTALDYAGGRSFLGAPTTPKAAVENLAHQIRVRAWKKAYASLANKGEFTESEFIHDLTGYRLSLRTYASLESFDVRPLHASADQADVQLRLHWSSVVGEFTNTRNLKVARNGDR